MVKHNEENNEEMLEKENPRKSFQRKLDKLKEEKDLSFPWDFWE